ncbi:class I SAM-dependent methyltransferase [Mycoplana ramosa]|uniref:Class I SAM-dependent methyltransferase n=1 Tax=Mycoplana ramosa TaxID=40837 RepID=A0ABW3YVU0_MYCRA
MTNYSNHIDEDVLKNWFSAKTLADPQLARFIESNDLKKTKPTFKDVCNRLFGCDNPYHAYKPELLPSPMPYTAHIGPKTLGAIEMLLGRKPNLGVEVGSFIGGSATILGSWLRETGGTLMCVDTWCGDINMWLLGNFAGTMRKMDGNPVIFDYFMNTMFNNGLTETVIPFRVSSIVAARTLKVLNYEIDFVYLDSAHECGETFLELSLYYDLLPPGGIMIGDDYLMFPAVKHDVDLFCKVHNLELKFTGERDTWIIQKPMQSETIEPVQSVSEDA